MDKSIVETFLKQVSHFDKHPLNTRPVFMDDNARPHRARVATDYLTESLGIEISYQVKKVGNECNFHSHG
jgi:hypothetical protein